MVKFLSDSDSHFSIDVSLENKYIHVKSVFCITYYKLWVKTRCFTDVAILAPLDQVVATTATYPGARCCRIDWLISVARVAVTFGSGTSMRQVERGGKSAVHES